jgi:hypothetical protein
VRNVLEVHHAAAVGFDAGYQTTAAQPRDDPRFSSWLLITVTVVQGIPTMGIPTMTKCLGACAMQSSSTYLGGWREHPSELRKLIGDVIEVSRTARTPVKAAAGDRADSDRTIPTLVDTGTSQKPPFGE